jgi:hypothetical protein
MGKSNTERFKKWRKKQVSLGGKQLSVMISRDAAKNLNDERARTGESIAKIIERVLMNLGSVDCKPIQVNDRSSVDSKQPDVDSKRPEKLIDPELLAQVQAEPVDPQRAKVEATLKQLRGQGLSYQNIAYYMNQKGIPTMSGKGVWRQGTVNKILKRLGVR